MGSANLVPGPTGPPANITYEQPGTTQVDNGSTINVASASVNSNLIPGPGWPGNYVQPNQGS
jgi:hypothetical protein